MDQTAVKELIGDELPDEPVNQSLNAQTEIAINLNTLGELCQQRLNDKHRYVDDQQNTGRRLPAIGVGTIFWFAHVISAFNHVGEKLEAAEVFFNAQFWKSEAHTNGDAIENTAPSERQWLLRRLEKLGSFVFADKVSAG